MRDAQVATLVSGLRGAQPVIVLVYLLLQRALTVQELRDFTGLSDDYIRPALQGLKAKGWLDVQRGERGKQTWLFRGDVLPGLGGQNPLPAETGRIQNPLTAETDPLRSSSSSSNALVPSIEPEEEEEAPESAGSGFWMNQQALDEAGVREPARTRLARLEHVTPEFVRAHVEQAKADGMGIGTAIHRIEYNWPAPEIRVGDRVMAKERRGRVVETLRIPAEIMQEVMEFTGHEASCGCMDCTVGRTRGISWLCPECRHYTCSCEESEDE